MAKQNDDLAAALNAMSNGEAANDDSAHGTSAGSHVGMEAQAPAASVTPPPARRPSATPRPAAQPPAGSTPARPSARAATPPATRAPAPAAPKAVAPAAAAAPPVTPAAGAARSSRPTAPSRAAAPSAPVAPPPVPASDSPFDQAPPEDDDAMLMPAPEASVFAPRPKAAPTARRTVTPVYQTLNFRQTIIPIMLTSGVMSIVLAAIRFSLPDDSFFAAVPTLVAIVLLIMGAALLAFGVLNVLQVKQMLEAKAREGTAGAK